MLILDVFVPVKPIPYKRIEGSTKRFVNKSEIEYRGHISNFCRLHMSHNGLEDTVINYPIYVDIDISFFRRKNDKKSYADRLYGDIDNHAKSILDALNGVVIEDDSLVQKLSISKNLVDPIEIAGQGVRIRIFKL